MTPAPPRNEEGLYKAMAAKLPPAQRHLFLGAVLPPLRQLDRVRQAVRKLAPPATTLSWRTVQRQLACHHATRSLLGPYYEHFAKLGGGRVSDRFLPYSWDELEAEVVALGAVTGFSEHCTQNYDRSEAAFYAMLAEVRGFRWLQRAHYDRIEALKYESRLGGGAPEAIAWRNGQPHLWEMKSLWAYERLPENDLQRLASGAYVIGTTGRLRTEDAGRPDMREGQASARNLRNAIHRLLREAEQQLVSYAAKHDINACPKSILLVVTGRQPMLAVFSAGPEVAQAWHRRHRGIQDIVWLGS